MHGRNFQGILLHHKHVYEPNTDALLGDWPPDFYLITLQHREARNSTDLGARTLTTFLALIYTRLATKMVLNMTSEQRTLSKA